MPLLYPVRRIIRSWKLFAALLIGVALASVFFAGIDVKANSTARQALDQQIRNILVDLEFTANLNSSNLTRAKPEISNIYGVTGVETLGRTWAPVATYNQPTVVVDQTVINQTEIVPFGYLQFAILTNNSRVYEGWQNKPGEELGVNETYILKGSSSYSLAENVNVGDVIQTSFTFYAPKLANSTPFNLNLTVKGFAQLSDEAYSVATGMMYYVSPLNPSIPEQRFIYRSD